MPGMSVPTSTGTCLNLLDEEMVPVLGGDGDSENEDDPVDDALLAIDDDGIPDDGKLVDSRTVANEPLAVCVTEINGASFAVILASAVVVTTSGVGNAVVNTRGGGESPSSKVYVA